MCRILVTKFARIIIISYLCNRLARLQTVLLSASLTDCLVIFLARKRSCCLPPSSCCCLPSQTVVLFSSLVVLLPLSTCCLPPSQIVVLSAMMITWCILHRSAASLSTVRCTAGRVPRCVMGTTRMRPADVRFQ